MGSQEGSSERSAFSTARAARSCPTPARTWRMRMRFTVTRGSVELIPAARVGVGYVLDEELPVIRPPRDPDHIEANRAIEPSAPGEIERRGARHVLALLPADRVQRTGLASLRPELHLHEHHLLAIARHEVDLAPAHAHVPVHDLDSAERKELRGDPLTAPGHPLPPHPASLPGLRSPR